MKKRHIITVLFIILASMFLVAGASPARIEFTYDFNKTHQEDTNIHYTDSVLFRVLTTKESVCRYTTVENTLPSNEFERNFGTTHEKALEDLKDNQHKYYVQCGEDNSNPVMEISFKTKRPISAQVTLSEDPPLKAGRYDVTLVTSLHPLNEPELSYSVDNKVYNKIPLEGDKKTYTGHIIIGENVGDAVGSFSYRATDLDGKEGTKITGDKLFIIDTKKPGVVKTVNAVGKTGQVRLSWYYEDEDDGVEEYRIYKSSEENVVQTDYFESTSEDEYIDNEVKKGKTYFYRIAAVDEAGNTGPMSQEISATALLENSTSEEEGGLDAKLIGKVDNLLIEIGLIEEDIGDISSSIKEKGSEEKKIFDEMELEGSYTDILADLASLKRDVKRFKLQDLSENELDLKIRQARVKMDIMRKKVPESITVREHKNVEREISEEKNRELILNYGQERYSPDEIEDILDLTNNLNDDVPVKIESEIYNFQINYLDGGSDSMSLIIDTIDAKIERNKDIRYLLLIPNTVAESVKDIDFFTRNYEVIKEDSLVAFESDVPRIKYSINEEVTISSFEDIVQGPVRIAPDDEGRVLMTGFSVFSGDVVNTENLLYLSLGVLFIALLFYFLILKRSQEREKKIKELIKRAEEKIENKDSEGLKEVYSKIKEEYKTLSQKEKKKHHPEIKKLHEK